MEHFEEKFYNTVLSMVFLHHKEFVYKDIPEDDDLKETYLSHMQSTIEKHLFPEMSRRYVIDYVYLPFGRYRFSKHIDELNRMKKRHSLSRDLFICFSMYALHMDYSIENCSFVLFYSYMKDTLSNILDAIHAVQTSSQTAVAT